MNYKNYQTEEQLQLEIVEKAEDIEESIDRVDELFDKLVKSYSDIYDKCIDLSTKIKLQKESE